ASGRAPGGRGGIPDPPRSSAPRGGSLVAGRRQRRGAGRASRFPGTPARGEGPRIFPRVAGGGPGRRPVSGESTARAAAGREPLERVFGERATCNACGAVARDYRVVALFLHETAVVRAYCADCYPDA